jgi:hypothetical protein
MSSEQQPPRPGLTANATSFCSARLFIDALQRAVRLGITRRSRRPIGNILISEGQPGSIRSCCSVSTPSAMVGAGEKAVDRNVQTDARSIASLWNRTCQASMSGGPILTIWAARHARPGSDCQIMLLPAALCLHGGFDLANQHIH